MGSTLRRADLLFERRRRSVTSFGTGFPLCYLGVRGRRTGVERAVPLLYVADGARVVLFGSNWGKRHHPAWALNLEAAGAATVTIDGVSRRMTARRATSGERDRYWSLAVEMWPGYDGYRRRAGREIRVYVLEPWT
jgi:deazaflavin-dependent oxidoreductase (nitroreductase family)